jgi:hypothetical protein
MRKAVVELYDEACTNGGDARPLRVDLDLDDAVCLVFARLEAAERLVTALENVRKLVLTTPIAREYDAARAAWEAKR